MRKGFTLLELLVVVLIIGVLTAIALPQYNLAVEKTRAAEAKINFRALCDAAERRYLEFRNYGDPPSKELLDVEVGGVPDDIWNNHYDEAHILSPQPFYYAVEPVGGIDTINIYFIRNRLRGNGRYYLRRVYRDGVPETICQDYGEGYCSKYGLNAFLER